MIASPDWIYVVKIWGDPGLNDRGWEILIEALNDADLEGEIWAAVQEAVTKHLPKPPRDQDVPDWFRCEVKEEAVGAALCPNPSAHTAYTVKSALRAAQEPPYDPPDPV